MAYWPNRSCCPRPRPRPGSRATVSPRGASPGRTPSPPAPSPATTFRDTVEVDGRRLGLNCFGGGQPTVIFIAGLTRPSEQVWPAIVEAVSPLTRVCVFDRAGMGVSDPACTAPQAAAGVVADLHAALAAAGERGPYVPVGFSMGGPFARLYASIHAAEVAGLVLIDPVPLGWAGKTLVELAPAAEREGERDYFAGRDLSLASPIDWITSEAQVLAAPSPNVPTVLLVRGVLDPEAPLEVEGAWDELQARQGRELRARVILATQSGHFIPIDQPELVSTAIQDVVAAVRDPSSWATPGTGTPAP